ncbi:MAG TPA: hypothetical protein VM285_12480, partial [Polyangia bacterium]|nr:hypothetical protein [Polyangia bacterium]
TPVVLSSHIAKTVRAVVSLPPGHGAEVVAAPDATGEWGSVTRRIRTAGNRLHVDIEATLDADRVPPERYGALLEFARAVDAASRVAVTVRPAR